MNKSKIAVLSLAVLLALFPFMAALPVCGNSIVEAGEACDDANVNGYMCSTAAAGFTSGTLKCQLDCSGYDISACIAGNTINAASCSQEDVQSAINSASEGSTVAVPQGICTWNTTVLLSKGIVLKGAGNGLTKIINGRPSTCGKNPGSCLILAEMPTNAAFRITGFYFDTGTGLLDLPSIYIKGKSDGSFPLAGFRIDHSDFNSGSHCVWASRWLEGVIEKNNFYNCNIGVMVLGDNQQSWLRPIEAGTSHSLFIEDNNFIINNLTDREPNEQIYHQDGGRSVVRNNLFDGSTYTNGNSILIDSHGSWMSGKPLVNGGYWTSDNGYHRGQPLIEVYNNVFRGHHTYQFTNFRGGSFLVHDNNFTTLSGNTINIFVLTDEESWQTLFVNPLRTQWPAEDQVNNSFFWNNTYNGAPITVVRNNKHPEDTIFIQENRDYFMHAPQATGGQSKYTGRQGASNAPPTESSPDTMIFDAAAPNAYYPYTPYIYPHPLALLDNIGSSALNHPPAITITVPANGATFSAPVTITINAAASDSDGAVSKVEFYNGTALLNTDSTAPYSYTWNNVAAGTYRLTAKATDNLGASAISADVTVIVEQLIYPKDDDLDGVSNTVDRCPRTATAARRFVNIFGCALPIATKFDIKPDFNATDINGMQNLELGISQYGKISYSGKNILLMKTINSEDDRLDIDADMNISQNKITLGQNNLPQLNVPATITLYNTNFANPKILKDGAECTACSITGYDRVSKKIVFSVPGF